MRVLMMTGAWPPEACGVGDYTAKLADHLDGGAEVIRYRPGGSYTRRPVSTVLSDIVDAAPDVIHIQYPAAGYLRSVVPSLLALHPTVRTVVTLHEFSIFRSYRSPWFLPFRFADALVFTNEVERGAFEKRFGRRKRNTAVIPIGSNIPAGRPAERDARSVVHFGLLMPGKGIERFFEFAALLKSDDFRLFLIGSAPAGAETYRRWIEAECSRLDICLHIDRSERDVADLLQTMRFAYLPFPDGASEKRGSLLAVLENGVSALTTHGSTTPAWIAECTVEAPTPEAAAALIRTHALQRADVGAAPVAYNRRGWSDIAERHIHLYAGLLEPSRSQAMHEGSTWA